MCKNYDVEHALCGGHEGNDFRRVCVMCVDIQYECSKLNGRCGSKSLYESRLANHWLNLHNEATRLQKQHVIIQRVDEMGRVGRGVRGVT